MPIYIRMIPHLEPLEGRRLMAGNAFVDVRYGTGGAASVRFRPNGNDAVASTQLAVAKDGSAYVLARLNNSVQVRKLTPSGQIDTTWFPEKKNLLAFPISKRMQKILVDAADRPLILVGNEVYRLTASGAPDAAFAKNGRLTLSAFSGDVDISVDATNKLYATGPIQAASSAVPKAGVGMLVERYISRGKPDKTFDNDGRATVPLPAKAASVSVQGLKVLALDNNTPADATDDKVLVAGAVGLPGRGTGLQVTRLTGDGSLDKTYGAGKKGYAYAEGGTVVRDSDGQQPYLRWSLNSIIANGTVSMTRYGVDEEGHTDVGDPFLVTANRGAVEQSANLAVDRSTRTFDNGYIGIDTWGGASKPPTRGQVEGRVKSPH